MPSGPWQFAHACSVRSFAPTVASVRPSDAVADAFDVVALEFAVGAAVAVTADGSDA